MQCSRHGVCPVHSIFCRALTGFYPSVLFASQRVSAARGVSWLCLLFTSTWCSASRIKMHPVLVVAIHQEERHHSRSLPFVPAFKQARGIDRQKGGCRGGKTAAVCSVKICTSMLSVWECYIVLGSNRCQLNVRFAD